MPEKPGDITRTSMPVSTSGQTLLREHRFTPPRAGNRRFRVRKRVRRWVEWLLGFSVQPFHSMLALQMTMMRACDKFVRSQHIVVFLHPKVLTQVYCSCSPFQVDPHSCMSIELCCSQNQVVIG